MVASGPPYIERAPLPEVSHPKPSGSVTETACGTKSDSFGNSGDRKIGERIPNLSNILGQTAQAWLGRP